MQSINSFGWGALFSGAVLILARQLFVALVRVPAKRMAADLWAVKSFARLFPLKDPTFSGTWEIEWEVESDQFPRKNSSSVEMYRFLDRVGGYAETPTTNGLALQYGFVGQVVGRLITGTWFDKSDRQFGYHGVFQLVLEPTREIATGRWAGFARDGTVKCGTLLWTRDSLRQGRAK